MKTVFTPVRDSKYSSRATATIGELKEAHSSTHILDIAPPEYQRLFQANSEWSMAVVSSVFKPEILIPELAVRIGSGIETSGILAEIMDGLQRLGSMFRFINGEITLPRVDHDLEYFLLDPDDEDCEPVNLQGLSFNELKTIHPEIANFFLNYELNLMIYANITSVEAGRIFVDILNNQNELNPQQKRQAIFSYVSRLVQRLSRGVLGKQHALFAHDDDHKCLMFNAKHTELKPDLMLAELTYMISSSQQFFKTGTTGATITNFYKKASVEFPISFPFETKLKKTLNAVSEGIENTGLALAKNLSSKEIRNYAYLVSENIRTKKAFDPILFLNLYVNAITDLKDKSLRVGEMTNTPYESFMRGNVASDTRSQFDLVTARMNELLSEMDNPDEVVRNLDSNRTYTETERRTLYDRQKGICGKCGEHMGDFGSHVEADHIVLWILGGQTTLENGQATHRSCNRRLYK